MTWTMRSLTGDRHRPGVPGPGERHTSAQEGHRLSLGDLLEGDDMADQTQAMAFLSLRRSTPTRTRLCSGTGPGDVDIEFDSGPGTPDPTVEPSS